MKLQVIRAWDWCFCALTLHCHPDSDERQQDQGRHRSREKLSMKRCHTKCDTRRGQVYTTWWGDTWYLSHPYQRLAGAAAAPLQPACPQLSWVYKKGGKTWNYVCHHLSVWYLFLAGTFWVQGNVSPKSSGTAIYPIWVGDHMKSLSVSPCHVTGCFIWPASCVLKAAIKILQKDHPSYEGWDALW